MDERYVMCVLVWSLLAFCTGLLIQYATTSALRGQWFDPRGKGGPQPPDQPPPKAAHPPTILQVLQYLTALGVTIVMLGLMVGAYFTPEYVFPVPGYLILLLTLGALIPGGREMVLAIITALLKKWS